MAGGDEAQKIVDATKDFGDHYTEISAVRVLESDRYPEGIKSSMQYGNAAGETVVRYDNFPDHPGAARHDKHRADGTVEDIEFEGLQALFQRFKAEVIDHGHDW